MTIFLLGFMGCGKSYVGRALAQKMGYDFIDLDAAIESAEEKKIIEIFDMKGEAAFRKIETAMLQKIYKDNTVISTGGGTPCFADNLEWMKIKGLTVFLNPSIDIISDRLKTEKSQRPLIAAVPDDELKNHIYKLYLQRLPYYEAADLSIAAVGEEDILKVIIEAVGQIELL
jgi:shikimate kinase